MKSNQSINILVIVLVFVLTSCEVKPRSWQYTKTIQLESVNPVGITASSEGVWLSDGGNNRMVRIDENGAVLEVRNGYESPMHIDSYGHRLYIPSYTANLVFMDQGNMVKPLVLSDSLEGPSGVWREKDAIAIANSMYNNVLFSENGKEYISIGSKGDANGEFNNPTDVQVTKNAIWVADATNNRIQVFDRKGSFLRAIGVEQNMNEPNGIFVSKKELFVADLNNDRVLVFDHNGALKQEISKGIDKPSDVILTKNQLIITNYFDASLAIYDWKKISEEE